MTIKIFQKTSNDRSNTRTGWFSAMQNNDLRVGVIRGMCEDGDILPVPEGFTRNECFYFVSPNFLSDLTTSRDIYAFSCRVNNSGQVAIDVENHSNPHNRANFIVIAIKGSDVTNPYYERPNIVIKREYENPGAGTITYTPRDVG